VASYDSAAVLDRVRSLVRARGTDPLVDPQAVRTAILDVLDEVTTSSDDVAAADLESWARELHDVVAGYGPLQRLFDDPDVEELWWNEPGRVFCARRGRTELTTVVLTEAQVHDLVERMLRTSGRRVDVSSPFVDALLPDGSRLHVVIPDVTRRHWAVNVRRHVLPAYRLDDLVGIGTLTAPASRFLQAAVVAGLNIVVAGGTQAGKTTHAKLHGCAQPSTHGSPMPGMTTRRVCAGRSRTAGCSSISGVGRSLMCIAITTSRPAWVCGRRIGVCWRMSGPVRWMRWSLGPPIVCTGG